jgi:hypothetical protein
MKSVNTVTNTPYVQGHSPLVPLVFVSETTTSSIFLPICGQKNVYESALPCQFNNNGGDFSKTNPFDLFPYSTQQLVMKMKETPRKKTDPVCSIIKENDIAKKRKNMLNASIYSHNYNIKLLTSWYSITCATFNIKPASKFSQTDRLLHSGSMEMRENRAWLHDTIKQLHTLFNLKAVPYMITLYKYALLISALMLAVTGTATAQIHLSTTTGSTPSATSVTISHTTGTQSDRLMLVGVSLWPNNSSAAVPTVTYGGTALTQVGTQWGNDQRVAIFSMLNPPSGTDNVVVTLPSGHFGAVVGVSTFASVNQTNPLGAFNSNTGISVSPSVNVASEAGNLVFDVLGAEQDADLTVGANQTERWRSTANINDHRGGGSTETATGASTIMSWSLSTSKKWTIGGVAINGTPITNTYSTPGTFTFVVPPGVSSITAATWGGGGRGGEREQLLGLGSGEAAGGGGGGYSLQTLSVTPGQSLTIAVGNGSNSTSPGGDSWVSTTANVANAFVLAKGGNSVPINGTSGASGGAASSGIGTVKFSGGNGSNVTGGNAGGGGSSAGTGANGNNATNNNGATSPSGGGNGGNGATSAGSGSTGSAPGGGGGGGKTACLVLCTGGGAGSGASGRVSLSYAGGAASSPGGVSSGLINWFKADQGVSASIATDGASNGWGSAIGGPVASNTDVANRNPTFNSTTNLINFNPNLNFNGSSELRVGTNINPPAIGDLTFFVLAQGSEYILGNDNGSWDRSLNTGGFSGGDGFIGFSGRTSRKWPSHGLG